MKRLGIEEPIRIEDDKVVVQTCSIRTDQHQVLFSTTLSSDPRDPRTFCKAMEGRNRVKWKPSPIMEINNFLSCDSWRKFPREKLKGHKAIPVKWTLAEEQDGSLQFKSHMIILKGYIMVPAGVDYTEFFSSVATDRTTVTVAVYWQGKGSIIEMIDIKAARTLNLNQIDKCLQNGQKEWLNKDRLKPSQDTTIHHLSYPDVTSIQVLYFNAMTTTINILSSG